MPECPEVRISAEIIKPLVLNKYVKQLTLGSTSRYTNEFPTGFNSFIKSFRSIDNLLVSSVKITDVETKGKFMYWSFDNGWYLFSTFGMTGQWSPTPGNHICLHMSLYDKNSELTEIYFNDPRHFGSIHFTNNKQDLIDKLNELGWDPFKDHHDKWIPWLQQTLKRIDKPIGQLLLDQSIFAGVGNYIRAEALYLSKMSPWKISKSLTKNEIINLCESITTIMNDSYNHQGATIQTYKDAYGNEGRYSSCFKVYGQDKDPLGNKVKTEETPDKRTIHWVPAVQK